MKGVNLFFKSLQTMNEIKISIHILNTGGHRPELNVIILFNKIVFTTFPKTWSLNKNANRSRIVYLTSTLNYNRYKWLLNISIVCMRNPKDPIREYNLINNCFWNDLVSFAGAISIASNEKKTHMCCWLAVFRSFYESKWFFGFIVFGQRIPNWDWTLNHDAENCFISFKLFFFHFEKKWIENYTRWKY